MRTPRQVIEEWYLRVSVTQKAHYLSADNFGRRKYWLGIPAVMLSTLVGTSVFASLEKQPEFWLQIIIGLASVTAALLMSLQTFLGYAERAEKHRLAAAKYGSLGRELEELLATSDEPALDRMTRARERLDVLAVESPNNSQWIYYKAGAGSLEAATPPK